MPKGLATLLSISISYQLLSSTSCKWYVLAVGDGSQSPVSWALCPTHGRWVTLKGLQLPGRDAPQYLNWELISCQVTYLTCRMPRYYHPGYRMLQATCTPLRPSLLHLGFQQGYRTTVEYRPLTTNVS